ncbi:MAG: EF-P lysine aminoacylase EpmA [Pirellulales bacterium]
MTDLSNDGSFRSTASAQILRQRAALLQSLRHFFDSRGMIEVQTPILSQDIVVDRHLDPLVVEVEDFPPRHGTSHTWYLQTSPEQNMKRLLASGLEAIYQIGPVFRSGEFGPFHNPEFTMVEWYRVGEDFEGGITFLEELTTHLLATAQPMRATFAEVFQKHLGIDALESSMDALADVAMARGHVQDRTWSMDRDDWINLLFSHDVQPQLGHEKPLVVTHFPATQAALARIADEDARTAERFEIFYRGVELANGYHELLDPSILRARNAIANAQRIEDGKTPLPSESRLLDAMESGLPACCGCALGFDRVVMLATESHSLRDVLCFPWDRA